MCDNCRMDSIVDSHFHIWDLALRRSYPYTDASFDWPGPQPATAAIHRDFTAAEVAAELGGSKVNNDNNCCYNTTAMITTMSRWRPPSSSSV